MTVKEFYDYAVINGFENFTVEIQYRDDGGCYRGTESLDKANFNVNRTFETVTI